MVFGSGGHNNTNGAPSGTANRSLSGSGEWAEPEDEPRDWKKIFLVIGLGALSWAATYVGMLELIQANLGDLPLLHKIIIGFSVAMLMTMIIWLLDQIFSPTHYGTKFFFVLGYIFLTVISVGFGFGFYWKVLESRAESTRSAESAIGQVQNSLHAGFTRLQQLTQTLQQLEQISTAKAVEERDKGTSCPNSRPGDGPRRKLRDADAQSFRFASDFVTRRVTAVETELTTLDADMQKVVSRDSSTIDTKTGTRNDFLRDLNRRLDITVTGFNSFRTDPQLRQIRADLNDRAGKTVFPTAKGGTFSCPDPQLQAALRGVVRAIDQLPDLSKPQVAAVEGSEATIEAFRRLTASLMGILTLTPPPTPDELRALQKKAVQSVSDTNPSAAPAYTQPTGLGKRDYIPLAIAIFVDLCLLLVSIGRPMNRLNGLIPKMREAERGPVIRILSRFNEIHRDPEIRQNFEVFRHVVFDYLGDYYVAVPLDTPYNRVGANQATYYGSDQAQELQHEAHLLSNLFASFEKEKIFKRVFFMPARTVRARLHRQGSKFAGSSAFRVYRFKEGAWSDIILGAVMGAAKRVEAEKEQRRIEEQARLDEINRRNGQSPGAPTFPGRVGAAAGTGAGEAGPSGKVPPFVLRHTPDLGAAATGGVGSPLNGHNARRNGMNGAANGVHTANGHDTGAVAAAGSKAESSPNVIYIEEDFSEEELAQLTPEEEEQIRSRYGKYADKILAERTAAHTRNARPKVNGERTGVNGKAHSAPTQSALDTMVPNEAAKPADHASNGTPRDNASNTSLTSAAANSNTAPVTQAEPTERLEPDTGGNDGADIEATIKLTRETATYTVPVSEARMPDGLAGLKKAVTLHGPVVTAQAALAEDITDVEDADVDEIASDSSALLETESELSASPENSVEESPPVKLLTPPPLPTKNGYQQALFDHDDDVEVADASQEDVDDIVFSVAQRFKPQASS